MSNSQTASPASRSGAETTGVGAGRGSVGRKSKAPDSTSSGERRSGFLAYHLRVPANADWSMLTVFVHGFCGNRSENGLFDGIAGRLFDGGCPVIQYDWRGIGSSEGSFQESTVSDHCQDLHQLLEHVREHCRQPKLRFNAIGFSLGAALIGQIAHKVQFARIAYLSPAVHPGVSMWPRYDCAEVRDAIERFGYFEKELTGIRVGRALLESLRRVEFGESEFKNPTPTLVCYGSNDQRIDPNLTREVVGKCKGVNKNLSESRIEGATHSFKPTEDHWEGLFTTVVGWMTQAAGHRHQ